ncbi:MAG: hypothetical protein M3O46_13995 [Myxococcota bacterium]|nr:hypothetical protein [Myxococcota bacterium]
MRKNRGRCSLAIGVAAALLSLGLGPGADASLGPSETEQVRHEVSTAQNVGHVQAIVARPDLTSDEAAAVMILALSTTPIDHKHAAYLHELVFDSASAGSRSTVALAVVRGLLARADALLAHAKGLDRNELSLAELSRAYALIEDVMAADAEANITDTARAECAHALAAHFSRNGSVLHPDEAVAPSVATVRAQAAIALLDATPDMPGRRLDVANALALSGARRAALIDLGILVLDAGGSDARVNVLRPLLERVPGARDGAEAIVVGDKQASPLRARNGMVVAVDAAPAVTVTEDRSPWGREVAPPPIDEATLALVHDLASAAVRRALERRPQLRAAVERDGGEAGVTTMAAMLELDAERTLDAAAARLIAGKRESVAWLSDAIGALAVFAPAAKGGDGLTIPLGRADAAGSSTVRATRVSLDAAGGAVALQFNAHTWRIARDDRGTVTGLLRDSAPVTAKMLPNVRPPAEEATSWSGGGLVFARLSGSPRAAVTVGRRILLFGSGLSDAIASPSPGDDVALETDLRVNGGPAGVAVRAVPGSGKAFKGVSVMVVPGTPPRAALLVADGGGVEIAAAPVIDLANGPLQHLRIVVRGQKVEAHIGTAPPLEALLPAGFEHGDVALRAYPGASVEAVGWALK